MSEKSIIPNFVVITSERLRYTTDMHKQKGFTVIEFILILVVFGVLCGAGVYVWHHNHHSTSAHTTSPPGTVPPPTPPANGWVEYTSTHSSLHFSYPKSWQLEKVSIPSTEPWLLEDVALKGPNNYVMEFTLAQSHVNSMMCVLNYYGSITSLSNGYVMAATLDSNNRANITGLSLAPASDKDEANKSGCPFGFYPISINSNLGFTLWGGYTVPGTINDPVSKSAGTYFSLPEVKTAQTIFASVKL